jgi:serine/threonine protein phosphatase PrpC
LFFSVALVLLNDYCLLLKADLVSREPHLKKIILTERDEFLIIACDGLWERISYQEAVDFVAEQRVQSLLQNFQHLF